MRGVRRAGGVWGRCGGTGRHVGGAVFVNVPAEMTGRWTLRRDLSAPTVLMLSIYNDNTIIAKRLLGAEPDVLYSPTVGGIIICS